MVAFSAAFGYLPPHEQCMVDALAPAGRQDAFWADVERDGARCREAADDRPKAPYGVDAQPLRAALGLWRLRRFRCHWNEWREGLRVWNWAKRRWEVHDR